jgi:hypothetical protein
MQDDNPPRSGNGLPGCQVDEVSVPQLVGEVYTAAPAADKARLLQFLLPTLGVLPLIVVANGLFARMRFRDGWSNFQVRVEDLQQVRANDVVSLVERVQLAGSQVLDGLAQTLASSPALATTAAAGILIVLLTRRAAERRIDEDQLGA